MPSSKHSAFVGRIGGYSIYYNDRNAKKDANFFIAKKAGRQLFRASELSVIILHANDNKPLSSIQRKTWLALSEEWDKASINHIKRL